MARITRRHTGRRPRHRGTRFGPGPAAAVAVESEDYRALVTLIPKAAQASHLPLWHAHPRDMSPDHRAQEKMNGVFVLWDRGCAL